MAIAIYGTTKVKVTNTENTNETYIRATNHCYECNIYSFGENQVKAAAKRMSCSVDSLVFDYRVRRHDHKQPVYTMWSYRI